MEENVEGSAIKVQPTTMTANRASVPVRVQAKRRQRHVQARLLSRVITESGVPTWSTETEGNTASSAFASCWWAPRCYWRDWLKTENKRAAALIWDGLVRAGRMRAS